MGRGTEARRGNLFPKQAKIRGADGNYALWALLLDYHLQRWDAVDAVKVNAVL